MSCGKPVIAFARGGPKETIKHEKTGYILEDSITTPAITAPPNNAKQSRN